MNVLDFSEKKQLRQKITVITCYDYTSARLIADTPIDCVLVGDSVAMTMHGFENTLSATLSLMCLHTQAVSRGINKQFIISDMPFLSYRKSLVKGVSAAEKLIQAGAHAVKLEGALGNLKLIQHLVESGIPVAGHLGLTPQSIHALGGYKVQGKTQSSALRLKEHAQMLQDAGCFTVFLECVPSQLTQQITSILSIPTIGIGAGPDCDGQVLVFQDLLGLNPQFKPRFVKTFIDGHAHLKQGIEAYVAAVHTGEFPQDEHYF